MISSSLVNPLRLKTTIGISSIIRWPSFHLCSEFIKSLPMTKYTEWVYRYRSCNISIKCAVGMLSPLSTSIGSTTTGKAGGKKSLTAARVISSRCWGVEKLSLSGLAPQGTKRTSSKFNKFIVSAATYMNFNVYMSKNLSFLRKKNAFQSSGKSKLTWRWETVGGSKLPPNTAIRFRFVLALVVVEAAACMADINFWGGILLSVLCR